MSILNKKNDFVFFVEVKQANPNGDPLNGNLPRTDLNGFGEISDVCIKRKIRNRMQDEGHEIFVKSNDRIDDDFYSLERRFDNKFKGSGKDKDDDDTVFEKSCEYWLDVRSFGQVMTFQKRSVGIRGPVSISIAKSLSPISSTSMQITRSTNGLESEKGKRSSDTMGTKHFVDYGVYMVKGSVNVLFSEKTGFKEKDLDVLKDCIKTLFVNDESTARPSGSMSVRDVFWFEHNSKIGNISSAKIFDCIEYDDVDVFGETIKYEDYNINLDEDKVKEFEDLGIKIERLSGI